MVAGIAQSTLMRRFFVKVAAIGVALWTAAAVAAATAWEQEPTAAGLWEKIDASGKPEAWFRISECRGVYEGQIVKIFPKPGEDPSQWRCTKCKGEQKNAPVLGITFIRSMRRNGLAYENGTILDPRDGSVYNARMELSPDGNHLTVRGYLGISLLGQSQVWRRLPDNALEPSKTDSCATMRDRSEVGTDRAVSGQPSLFERSASGAWAGGHPNGHVFEISDRLLCRERGPVFLTIINDPGVGSCCDRGRIDPAVDAGDAPRPAPPIDPDNGVGVGLC